MLCTRLNPLFSAECTYWVFTDVAQVCYTCRYCQYLPVILEVNPLYHTNHVLITYTSTLVIQLYLMRWQLYLVTLHCCYQLIDLVF